MKVIVVGAGIAGASTGYHLARLGAEVIIVDRKDAGQATEAAAGIICPWLSQRRNKAWYRLAKAGARYYPELIAALEQDGESNTGYARVGALHIHTDSSKLDKLEERALTRRADATAEIGSITRLDAKHTQEQFPLLAEHYASVHISGAARVDGRALRDALLRAAQKYGAELINGDAVVTYEGHRVTGVTVGLSGYTADAVVVCAGAWAGTLLQPLGIDFQVRHQKAQIMHVQLPDEEQMTGSWPVVMPPSNQYLLAFEQQQIVIGSTHENTELFDTRVTVGGMYEILSQCTCYAPALTDCTFGEVRVGFRPYTADFLPVVGAVPGWEGLLVTNGLGASGLTMGPYIGSQLARLTLGLELDIELADYDVRKALDYNELH
ncbi:NAD(P)/FAD-dependent oxidoreductase [Paenibacillus xylaniclasticus]|uniref:NAD(P)/FAD-dependent oxidoreductase n=1 Tax=Paenibacillus xylaniclasticus TaxID=588083 RepID=UPI000FDC1DEF|nr:MULTISPECIES: FAD-dependent oxidoreductase [Paenibacillus]GFN33030.1 putative oxidoreductase YurR [Paenibacillus curdlanolyticus]